MARIPDLPPGEGSVLTRVAYRYSRKQFGKVLAPLRVIAHNPETMLAYGAFEGLSARATTVDVRLKNLAVIKTSTLVGCPF